MGNNDVLARPRQAHRRMAVAFTGILLAIAGTVALAPAADAGGLGGHMPSKKISICQATGDRVNPYIKREIDLLVALHLSHGGHSGPSLSDKVGEKGKWGDVIPPFELGEGKGHFGGKNWDKEGMDIHFRGCKCPDTDKPKPTIPTPGTKPGTPPTKPVDTKPPTTVAKPVASTVAPTTVAVKGASTVAPTTAAKASLPVTGSSSGLLVFVGLALTAAGGAVLFLRQRSVS